MKGRRWTRGILLAIGGGIVVGILATFLLEHDMRAVVLGSLVAVAIADASAAGRHGMAGLFTGAGIGLFMAARGESVLNESLVRSGLVRVVASLAATMMVSGLVGAVYGFIAGEAKKLYDEGRGPFF